jgi:hypothetical protein
MIAERKTIKTIRDRSELFLPGPLRGVPPAAPPRVAPPDASPRVAPPDAPSIAPPDTERFAALPVLWSAPLFAISFVKALSALSSTLKSDSTFQQNNCKKAPVEKPQKNS